MPENNGRAMSVHTVEVAVEERDWLALKHKIDGKNYREIGEELGVSRSAAAQMVVRALADHPLEAIEDVMRLELARLDDVEAKARAILDRKHYAISVKGDWVVGPDGNPVEDDTVALKALAQITRCIDQRSKLRGLYVERVAVVAQVNLTGSDEARASIEGLLTRLSA